VATRVINTVHVMKRPTPNTLTPTRAASSNILGLANNIIKIVEKLPERFELHVPDWNNSGRIRARESILALADQRRNTIRQGGNNPYRRSQSATAVCRVNQHATAAPRVSQTLNDPEVGEATADGTSRVL